MWPWLYQGSQGSPIAFWEIHNQTYKVWKSICLQHLHYAHRRQTRIIQFTLSASSLVTFWSSTNWKHSIQWKSTGAKYSTLLLTYRPSVRIDLIWLKTATLTSCFFTQNTHCSLLAGSTFMWAHKINKNVRQLLLDAVVLPQKERWRTARVRLLQTIQSIGTKKM